MDRILTEEIDNLLVARELLTETLDRPLVTKPDSLATLEEILDLAEKQSDDDNIVLADVEEILCSSLERMSGSLQAGSSLEQIAQVIGKGVLRKIRMRRREILVDRASGSWVYLDLVYGWPVLNTDLTPTLHRLAFVFDKDTGFKRERHGDGVGYHYHLLNGNKQRSDVALTFCADGADCCPVVWYKHAERDKPVKVNPDRWRMDRRLQISNRCLADAGHLRSSFVRPPKGGAWLVLDPECPNSYKRP